MEQLRIEYKNITWCFDHIYEDNPKLHDIGSIVEAIQKHGFRNPVIWDETLGAIVAGNGRVEAVHGMWQKWLRTGGLAPKGIQVEGDQWSLPVVYGLSAPSIAGALAYLVDDNNLTVMGGDFTAVDTMRLWGPSYLQLLASAENVTSVDAGDIALMGQLAKAADGPLDLGGVVGEPSAEDDNDPVYFLRVVFEDEAQRDEAKERLRDEAEAAGTSPAQHLYNLLQN